jgi:thioredoxin-related protein
MLKLRVLLPLLVLPFFLMSAGVWRSDFDKAKADAKAQHKLVLLKFSGSDWCIPCIRMEKDIFSKDTFQHFAESNLVMVNADFPRLAKNKPDKAVVKQNDALAEKYDRQGHFPYTVLLDADGRVLKVWDGYTGVKPEELIAQIRSSNAAL